MTKKLTTEFVNRRPALHSYSQRQIRLFLLDQELLQNNSTHKYIPESLKGGGRNECLAAEIKLQA